jgi:uncharacterized phage-like protein YoqJ
VSVYGHRLAELGGYDDNNPVTADVQCKLTEILQDLQLVQPDPLVLTGLGLGAEQLAATAAAKAGVPYMAVLAFPGQEKAWPQARRVAYEQLLAGATATITLSAQTPAGKPEVGPGHRPAQWLDGDPLPHRDRGVGRTERVTRRPGPSSPAAHP